MRRSIGSRYAQDRVSMDWSRPAKLRSYIRCRPELDGCRLSEKHSDWMQWMPLVPQATEMDDEGNDGGLVQLFQRERKV